jgi:hypothetical protein
MIYLSPYISYKRKPLKENEDEKERKSTIRFAKQGEGLRDTERERQNTRKNKVPCGRNFRSVRISP